MHVWPVAILLPVISHSICKLFAANSTGVCKSLNCSGPLMTPDEQLNDRKIYCQQKIPLQVLIYVRVVSYDKLGSRIKSWK